MYTSGPEAVVQTMASCSEPLPTSGHSLETLDGEVLCFGGLQAAPVRPLQPLVGRMRPHTAPTRVRSSGGARASNRLHAFSLEEQSWRDLEPENDAPPARTGHACCTLPYLKSSMLIFGGADAQHKELDDAWQLELRCEETVMRWRYERALPCSCHQH